jgi:pimeloyl-ACP methyl ester carboxylesterase
VTDINMHVLLLHGMGRSPLAMRGIARRLKREGMSVELFGYLCAVESFDRIVDRLVARMSAAGRADAEGRSGEYSIVGHSLGGLLARAALARMPAGERKPRDLVMLGTPNRSPRLARILNRRIFYSLFAGDAGRKLADPAFFESLPHPKESGVRCLIFAGAAGPVGRLSPFGRDPNDMIVSVEEARLDAPAELIEVPNAHTFMMYDGDVIDAITARLREPVAESMG